MSDIHIEEHSSPIKTPAQLVIVVVLAFAVPPKGGNLALTDTDVNAAVDYMVHLVK